MKFQLELNFEIFELALNTFVSLSSNFLLTGIKFHWEYPKHHQVVITALRLHFLQL